jgi:hypothetical protein
MSQLPAGTIGDAVGVLIFTFICLFTNILLISLLFISHDRLGCKLSLILQLFIQWTYQECANPVFQDVALISHFALVCTISSIIQQIYNYRSVSRTFRHNSVKTLCCHGLMITMYLAYGMISCGRNFVTSRPTIKMPTSRSTMATSVS